MLDEVDEFKKEIDVGNLILAEAFKSRLEGFGIDEEKLDDFLKWFEGYETQNPMTVLRALESVPSLVSKYLAQAKA